MSSWSERLLTCMHGVQEGLDSHSCEECQTIARNIGLIKRKNSDTFIFTSQKQVDKLYNKGQYV